MVDVLDARVAYIRAAGRLVDAARGTARSFLREPDDSRLDQMADRLVELEATHEADRPRWGVW